MLQQSPIPGAEGLWEWVATSYQHVESRWLWPLHQVEDGDDLFDIGVDLEGGLHDLN